MTGSWGHTLVLAVVGVMIPAGGALVGVSLAYWRRDEDTDEDRD